MTSIGFFSLRPVFMDYVFVFLYSGWQQERRYQPSDQERSCSSFLLTDIPLSSISVYIMLKPKKDYLQRLSEDGF